jgi:hypothetical protein
MDKRYAVSLIPVALASLFLVSGCDAKPKTEKVVVEEGIVLNRDSHDDEWIVDDIVPIPAHKSAGLAGARPSNEHIWLSGEWNRNGDKLVWQSGRWERPPIPNANWLVGHWRYDDDKWHWTAGHWVVTNRPHYVGEALVAPASLPESRPEQPLGKDHWIAGYWEWNGEWTWLPGYWTSKPADDAEWVVAHWETFGLDGGYRWIGGHWRVKD